MVYVKRKDTFHVDSSTDLYGTNKVFGKYKGQNVKFLVWSTPTDCFQKLLSFIYLFQTYNDKTTNI